MISIVDLVNELLMLVSKNIMKKTIGKIQTNQSRVVIYVKKGNKKKMFMFPHRQMTVKHGLEDVT